MTGLSSDEAVRRLSQVGPNTVTDPHVPMIVRIARRFWAPVPWMLEATVLLQLVIGGYLEAAIIAALLIFNVALGLFQEGRARAALTALKSKLALCAYAKRDGRWTELAASDLVPGDIVRLSVGSVVPADARLLDGTVLLDQSMLTGESIPAEVGPGRIAYAGAQVRRGGATAEVTATGAGTYFGRTAELVRIAHPESSEQKAVFAVVRNLAVFNGAIVVLLVGYARAMAMPVDAIIPLVLTALLGSIPVALPATFALAAALGAQVLTKEGILLTRLSALHEASTVDVLCADKTGTLTRNELTVTAVKPLREGASERSVLELAALASAKGGQDPVDAAIRACAREKGASGHEAGLIRFTPFDPGTKYSEATIAKADGLPERVMKGAPAAIAAMAAEPASGPAKLKALTSEGFRVLAVAADPTGAMEVVGYIGLSDLPRLDSKELLVELRSMGVRTVMVTGDGTATAAAVARQIGLEGPVCPPGGIPHRVSPDEYAVYAGVFPEDKFHLVKAFQRGGHTVAMCGDGANDAPALRQAQMGIAVSTATDVAKSAASLVLTEPGLGGIVKAIKEGRSTFQRILTYTMSTLVKKVEVVLFLAVGLFLTGHAVLTPMLMALILVTGDFMAMSLTTDRATPSKKPDRWRIRKITRFAILLGLFKLMFSSAVLAAGAIERGMTEGELQTLAFITLAFGNQMMVYVLRERNRMWHSRPSTWLVLSTLIDVSFAFLLASTGVLMAPLPIWIIALVLAGAVVFSLFLDTLKLAILSRIPVS